MLPNHNNDYEMNLIFEQIITHVLQHITQLGQLQGEIPQQLLVITVTS